MGRYEIIEEVTKKIISYKNTNLAEKVMSVSIEGLSNSGKSTLSKDLSDFLNKQYPTIMIEGDKFHVGYTPAMKIYNQLIEDVKKGLKIKADFPSKIWRFNELKTQLLDRISEFNFSGEDSKTLKLERLLENKVDGSEHEENYNLSKKTIVLVCSMFLRHLHFDYSIFLKVDPEVSIKRKIERTIKDKRPRDPKITELMVKDIEYPAILDYNSLTGPPNLVIDTNNFESMKIF